MSKYFLCIKKIETTNGEQLTTFVKYAFYTNLESRWRYDNFYNYDDYYNAKEYNFTIGRVYIVNSNGIITDDSGIHHEFEKLKGFFKAIEFEIDPQAKSIINIKEKKGDTITIEPYSLIKDGKLLYKIVCFYKDFRYHTLSTSQVDGILCCYHNMRLNNHNTQRLRRMITNKHFIYDFETIGRVKYF